MKRLFLSLAVLLSLTAFADQAHAQFGPGFVSTTINLRAGPGQNYPAFVRIGAHQPVQVYGCLDGYNWCDVGYGGTRGWVHSRYLVLQQYNEPVISYGPQVGVPIIIFNQDTYWDRYYRDRPFYRSWYAAHPRPVVIERREVIHDRPVVVRRDHIVHEGEDARGYDHHDNGNHYGWEHGERSQGRYRR